MGYPKSLFTLKTTQALFTPVDGGEPLDFSDHINQITLNPSAGGTQFAVSGAKYVAASSWNIQLGLFQDLDKTGFLRFLFANDGKKYKAKFTFLQGQDALQATVNISPASIGGNAGTDLPTSSVTLEIDGAPEWVAPEATS